MTNKNENYLKLSNYVYRETGKVIHSQIIVGLMKQFGEVLEMWSRSHLTNKDNTPPLCFKPDNGRIARSLKCSTPRIWAGIGKLEKMGLLLKEKGFISIDFPNIDALMKKYENEENIGLNTENAKKSI